MTAARRDDDDREALGAVAEFWDREPDAVWEPPGLRRFQTGDRIRVQISLECEYCLDPEFLTCYERALADNGRTGTVYDVGHAACACRWDDEPPNVAHIGHDVWVTWDERRDYDDPVLPGVQFDAHFAASELVLIHEAPASSATPPGAGGEA